MVMAMERRPMPMPSRHISRMRLSLSDAMEI
jgi:hypothetical protein